MTNLRLVGGVGLARRAANALLCVTLLAFMVPSAFGQATTGSIGGTVTDPSGAVIPGAEVTASELATGIQTRVSTNADGIYSLPKLKGGLYTLTVVKQGFKRQEFQQVTVNIGQDLTLDAILQAGQVSETVTVTAAGQELIQKEEVQISSTFDTRQVADLPSNPAGSGIDALALLTPGVVPGFGNVNSNGITLSVNGQRARSNNFTIDGGDNNDMSIGGPSFFVDNQDTVAEFQVITNNFSAEYGHNQGAIVNIVTKSGTNQYHGTAAWFHRDNSFLDALDNFQKGPEGLSGPPPFIYNLWEGTFGGPIIKDRLFFFGSFQYITQPTLSLLNSGSPTIAPSALGELSANNPGNAAIQVLAHDSAFAVPGRTVTAVPGDPTNQTVTINGVNYPVLFPQVQISTPTLEKEFSVRGDYKITDKQNVWFREFYQISPNKNAAVFDNVSTSNGFAGDIPANGRLSTAQYTYQVSNTAVNEFRFVYNRLGVLFGGGCAAGLGCIPNPLTDLLNTTSEVQFTGVHPNFPGTTTPDGSLALQTIGVATNLPQGRTVSVYQFTDNFSKVWGRHEFKFGADIRRDTNLVPFLPNANGHFNFNSVAKLEADTPSTSVLAAGTNTITYNETDKFFYFQDNWKIKDNLTLNLGVRYENSGQPINTLHDISVKTESNPATALWLQSLPLDQRTFPAIPTDNHEFAPRLGFAWTPRVGDSKLARAIFGGQDKTVISGGYSIAYDPAFYNILLNISTSSPLVFNSSTLFPITAGNLTGTTLDAYATANHIIAVNTFNPKVFTQTNVGGAGLGVGGGNFTNPYSQQWSFRWQRELGHNQVFEARYVGTHGIGLFTTENGNPYINNLVNGFSTGGFNFPGFGNSITNGANPVTNGISGTADGREFNEALVRSRLNDGQSLYHALQMRYQARVFNQLSLGVNYTRSKALDNASEIFAFTENPAAADPFNLKNERGYSGFDRPNAMSLNFIWDIPLFKEQRGLIGHVAGGWQFNGIYNLANGQRYTPSDAFAVDFLGTGYVDPVFDGNEIGFDSTRPFTANSKVSPMLVAIDAIDANLVFGLTPPKGVKLADNVFYSMNAINTTGAVQVVSLSQVHFVVNGPGAAEFFHNPFGDATRGSLQGPLFNNANLGLFKNIRVREAVTLQLRLEAFNAFNHPNPGTLNSGGITPDFFVEDGGSQPLGTGFANNNNSIEESARVVQVGVRVIF
jgi:outer membrane receptor protein involved in Fe transport